MEIYRSTARFEKTIVTEDNLSAMVALGVTNDPKGSALGKVVVRNVRSGMISAILSVNDFDNLFELSEETEPE